MLATRNNMLEAIELLLSHGANIKHMSKGKQTAIDIANIYGHGHLRKLFENHLLQQNRQAADVDEDKENELPQNNGKAKKPKR